MPKASIADRRQSSPLTARTPSVQGTGVYRQYLPPRADSSDLGLLGGAKFPKMRDSLPRTPTSHRAKFDAVSFILVGEIRNRTNTQKQTNKRKTVNDIYTPWLSACVDNKRSGTVSKAIDNDQLYSPQMVVIY